MEGRTKTAGLVAANAPLGELFDWPAPGTARNESVAGTDHGAEPQASAPVESDQEEAPSRVALPAKRETKALRHVSDRSIEAKSQRLGRAGALALLAIASVVVGYFGSRALMPPPAAERAVSSERMDPVTRGTAQPVSPANLSEGSASTSASPAAKTEPAIPAGPTSEAIDDSGLPRASTPPSSSETAPTPAPSALPSAGAPPAEPARPAAAAVVKPRSAEPPAPSTSPAAQTRRKAVVPESNSRPARSTVATGRPSSPAAAPEDRQSSTPPARRPPPEACTEAIAALGLCSPPSTR